MPVPVRVSHFIFVPRRRGTAPLPVPVPPNLPVAARAFAWAPAAAPAHSAVHVPALSPYVYRDAEGHLCAGYGHRLTKLEQERFEEGDLVDDVTLEGWFQVCGARLATASGCPSTRLAEGVLRLLCGRIRLQTRVPTTRPHRHSAWGLRSPVRASVPPRTLCVRKGVLLSTSFFLFVLLLWKMSISNRRRLPSGRHRLLFNYRRLPFNRPWIPPNRCWLPFHCRPVVYHNHEQADGRPSFPFLSKRDGTRPCAAG